MESIGFVRKTALRGMYAFMVFGLALTVWPDILFPQTTAADSYTVINAMLAALSLLWLVGIRYPIKMLPLLFFELLWKLMWVLIYVLRMHFDTGLDAYATESLFACMVGIVLIPIVMPWKYLWRTFVIEKGPAFRKQPKDSPA